MTSYIQIEYLVTRYKWHISVALEVISKKKIIEFKKVIQTIVTDDFKLFTLTHFIYLIKIKYLNNIISYIILYLNIK